jgi:CelD/BcsL family acetyltransferase involved in cellulose biosynthesis
VSDEARVETITELDQLAPLAAQWDDLVRSAPRPSPFLLHDWMAEWWRHYGEGRASLRIHVALRGDVLVGALPVCTRGRLGLRVTEFVGGTKSPLADVLLARSEDGDTAAALVERLGTEGSDYVDLSGLRAESLIVSTLPRGSLELIERIEAPVLEFGESWSDTYKERVSAKARSERRRHLRRLERFGPVEIAVGRSGEEIGGLLGEASRIHQLRWNGLRDTSGFDSDVGQAFRRAVLARLARQGIPRLVTVSVGEQMIAFSLHLLFERTVYGMTMGFDPSFAAYSPGTETLFSSLESAAADGAVRVEFLGADMEYKRRLADGVEPLHEGLGLAGTARGRLAVEALTRGIRVRRRLKQSAAARRLYARVPRLGRAV